MGEASRRKLLNEYPETSKKQTKKKITKREILDELSKDNPLLAVARMMGKY